MILGPPGTGKTHLLAWLILGYILSCREAGKPCRVLVSAFTRVAIGNLLDSVAKRVAAHDAGVPLVYLGSAPPDGLATGRFDPSRALRTARPRPAATSPQLSNGADRTKTPRGINR